MHAYKGILHENTRVWLKPEQLFTPTIVKFAISCGSQYVLCIPENELEAQRKLRSRIIHILSHITWRMKRNKQTTEESEFESR
jgi:hypothetical protein